MINNFTNKDLQVLINNLNAKNYNFVISKANILLKKNPQEIILRNLLGLSYQGLGKFEEAREIFNEGLKYHPKDESFKNNLAKCYNSLFEYKIAEKLYKEIIEANPNYPAAYLNLGNQKRDLNQLSEAVELYENAMRISPNNPTILYALALAHRSLGNFDKAIEFAKKVITIDPKFTRADLLISRCVTYNEQHWHYNQLIKKTDNRKLINNEDIELCFSISKAYEDIKNFSKAYEFLKIGNDLRKEKSKYKIDDDLKLINEIKYVFKDINLNNFSSIKNEKIIFVVGMPRSGTSLIEQIITSHSLMFGGGELPYMDILIKKYFFDNDKIQQKKIISSLHDKEIISYTGEQYLDYTKNLNTDNKIFLDKSLLNFLWIGFIKIIFPNAKIIHCYREAKNNCLSIYKNLFRDGLGFAHNENDLVKFYKAYQDLMAFWKTKKIDNLIDVNYEDLIANTEFEVRKIINHCELEWEDNCLNFHKNKNPIKTISASQARKPIYKSSLNIFDEYKDYLKVINKNL